MKQLVTLTALLLAPLAAVNGSVLAAEPAQTFCNPVNLGGGQYVGRRR